jgi:uncharacterized BrkB/YihY/UPF0761 family membrane protein
VLLVTITLVFIDRDKAGKEVIGYVESYIPISGEMQHHIFDTIAGVVKARGQAGVIALLMLVWAATQVFTTLICATNRAWSTEVYNWWRLPLKSLVLLGIMASALLLGLAVPVFARMANPIPSFYGGRFRNGSYVNRKLRPGMFPIVRLPWSSIAHSRDMLM